MTDLLFSLMPDGARLLQPAPARLEKEVQVLVERNMQTMLGHRFLVSEYSTPCGTMRIDSLCIDQHHCPIIVEYKLDSDSSAINQGLCYLDWLISNKAAYQLVVHEALGADVASKIDWTGAKVVIIAGHFTRYDLQAIHQINANLDLYTYCLYEGAMLLRHVGGQRKPDYLSAHSIKSAKPKRSFLSSYTHSPDVVRNRVDRFCSSVMSIADDIVLCDRDDGRFISAPASSSGDLGRLFLTDTLYPKVRLEIFASIDDFEFTAEIRTKKTRKQSFEFSVTDDEYFDHAVEAIRQLYSRSQMG